MTTAAWVWFTLGAAGWLSWFDASRRARAWRAAYYRIYATYTDLLHRSVTRGERDEGPGDERK